MTSRKRATARQQLRARAGFSVHDLTIRNRPGRLLSRCPWIGILPAGAPAETARVQNFFLDSDIGSV